MLPRLDYYRRNVYQRLPELDRVFKTPFYLYDKRGIKETGEAFKKAFAKIPHREYFAVKALPEEWVMEFLFKELGFGFDCSSIPEVVMARALGAQGDDIIFTSNDTSDEEFEFISRDRRNGFLNLDDISFIPLVPVFPDTIILRASFGKRRTGLAKNPIGDPYNAKYGIPYEQMLRAFQKAKRRGAKYFGIHTMLCSNEKKAPNLVETVRGELELAGYLYRKAGLKMKYLNPGGGFGIPYKPSDNELNIDWIGQRVTKLLQDFAAQYGFMPKFMTECGRFITGHHGLLVNKVLHVMQKYRHFIGVQAAMTGCPRVPYYAAYHWSDGLDPNGNLRRGPCHFTNIVGPKCEDWDRLTPVGKPRWLPKSIKRGDFMVTHNCGAHCYMDGEYNGRLRIKALLDQDGENENVIEIRRAQTMEDYFRTTTPSPNWKLPGQK